MRGFNPQKMCLELYMTDYQITKLFKIVANLTKLFKNCYNHIISHKYGIFKRCRENKTF